ncbi:hypothetical protein Mal64_18730 [Pseudobythopirellula maris]|uniref:Uncharacterized protein n=1 Tax=Pseudobythopirellula maris TaxID=2527991 RepID=A0A5C5ZPX7_9BACT|nr:hypothetical protein [Pseudobythopirellula maris]TWT88393.1 hypothetical protein Mal64_18730 [Pseudobythopirellula maris]
MQIDLPDTTIQLAAKLAQRGEGSDAADVIVRAIARMEDATPLILEGDDAVKAVQEGIDAYKAGQYEPLEDFDRRYREEQGIPPRS